ncbi:MAG: molybdopterin converting factor subunit 1 [Gammaproteobacteria bacterium]|nr:molybdopterin converting factor subunit 1 [Gammaproteobacteria bacterium]
MKVKVRLFASLREEVGIKETEIELDDGATANSLWRQVVEDRDMPSGVMTAVNLDYARPDTALSDGDEVAFFPPVTGG